MGYSYDSRDNLCCDYCGHGDPNTKKVPCPFGYCPSPAVCPICLEMHADDFTVEFHRVHGCEKKHNEHVAWEAERKSLIASGKPVRCSALTCEEGVHVLFDAGHNGTVGFYMSPEAYWAFDLLSNRTPEDFAKHGTLTPAPDHFGTHKRATTEVA